MHRITHRLNGQTFTATVNPVGAALVGLRVGAVDVVQPLTDPTDPPLWAGATLAPWPNRIRGGVWTLDGKMHRLELNDRMRRNAIHGLVSSTRFTPQPGTRDERIILSTLIEARPGYPFTIALSVTYQLDGDGLTVTYASRNVGRERAPFAVGAHPYFVAGKQTADLTLTLPARTVLINDEQAVPVDREPVAGALDLRTGRPVDSAAFNHCFTDLAPTGGELVCTLAGPDALVEVWGQPAFAYWQVYNPADFPGPHGPTRALAVEPMTAPPDALNSGEGVRWLEPDETWCCTWGVRAEPRPARWWDDRSSHGSE